MSHCVIKHFLTKKLNGRLGESLFIFADAIVGTKVCWIVEANVKVQIGFVSIEIIRAEPVFVGSLLD